jgi:hypothetical protein
MRFGLLAIMVTASISVAAQQRQQPPREWIDPDTGHRVIRLSDEPGSASLYFHQNPYTPDGKHVWYDLQTPKSQVFWLASYELETGQRM